MRYFMTFFWTFLLTHMVTYVGASLLGSSYDVMTASILGIGATILILIISAIIPNDPVETTQH
jgi:cell shape-determining protein MreD